MNRIAINGASGDLGRKVAALLLAQIPVDQVRLVTRTPHQLAELQQRGVEVRPGDYRKPHLLESAYEGCSTLMMISGFDVTHRIPEHRNAIAAAKQAGVRHIVYTSVAGIHPRNPTLSASDHIATEADLRASGLGYTILRNATYAEVFPTVAAQPPLRTGRWVQVKGNGMLAPVSKRDIARCAVACLIDPAWHDGAVYEISGPELVSFRQIAALTSQVYGVPIEYVELGIEERFAELDAMGVPRKYSTDMPVHPDAHLWCSEEMVTADIAFQQGFHAILSGHVQMITGQPPLALREVFTLCKGKAYADC